jgi:hypothetical protein
MVTTIYKTKQEAENAAVKLLNNLLSQGYSITMPHTYTDRAGNPSHWRVRLDHPEKGKEIRPIAFIDGKWEVKEPDFSAGKPLYNLHEISSRPNETVWIVEGEKCADALMELGLLATTSGSASSAEGADWTPLYGREIVCWPDNDESGIQYVENIKNILIIKILKINFVDLNQIDLPEKGDCVDWLEKYPDSDQSDIERIPLIDLNAFHLTFGNWEEPVLPQSSSPPDIPACLLPEPFSEYAEALAKSIEVPEGLAVLGILGTVSSAISHRFKVSPKPGWQESTNLYILSSLQPGNNKSATLKACTGPLTDWEKNKAELMGPEIKKAQSKRKTIEEQIKRRRTVAIREKDHDLQKLEFHEIDEMESTLEEVPALPQIFATDATPESLAKSIHEQGGRFAVICDEGGIMDVISGLYTKGQANINIVLNGIDGGAVRIKRQESSIDINPILTFCLFVQPAILQNMSNQKSLIGKGLRERFLYFVPATKLGYRTHDTEPVSPAIKEDYEFEVFQLLELCMDTELDATEYWLLKLSPEASIKFKAFQMQIEKELRPEGELHAISGWGGKICGFALRIAGLMHVMECGVGDGEISSKIMERAIELACLLIKHALIAFDQMAADPSAEDAKIVFNWIKSNGQCVFKKNDCHRELGSRFPHVRQLEEALEILRERNIVSDPILIYTGGKGRPNILYKANPHLFVEMN